jgi:hypothetical protein
MRLIAALFALLTAFSVSAEAGTLVTPIEHRRPADQTFLTVPEWFLVFSPEEYADALAPADRRPSQFPFFAHIGQFWSSYYHVARETAPPPANAGYHVMVGVIGVSTTVEYALKGGYERIAGSFTEAATGNANSAEDQLAARVANDYVVFIKVRPWYEFDFWTPLKELWSLPAARAGGLLRKWERRYALTSEWLVKAGYAKLIEAGTRSSYDVPIERTYSIVRVPGGRIYTPPDSHIVARDGEQLLLDLPRRQVYADVASALAAQGGQFEEIAGNRKDVLITIIAPAETALGGREIYRQPILTQPGMTRFAIAYPIATLGSTLDDIRARKLKLEHIYDF